MKKPYAIPSPRGLEVLRAAVAAGRFEEDSRSDRNIAVKLNALGYLDRDRKLASLWFATEKAADMLAWLDTQTADAVALVVEEQQAAAAVPAVVLSGDASEIVMLVERSRRALDDGDVTAAMLLSGGAYEQAKAAGGYAAKVKASRQLIDKFRAIQADALKVETFAHIRLADMVDEAQNRGQLAKPGRKSNILDENILTLSDFGLDAKQVHEARKLREAERETPGIVERAIDARVSGGLAPTRASLRHAIGTQSATKEERGDDLYETPVEAMRVLLALESFCGPVLEPSVGRGAILRPLEAAGYEVMISDLVDREITTAHGECQMVGDFLASTGMADAGRHGPDIVTNPPFGIANAYIAHALKAHRPRKMAMLLNFNFAAGFDDPDRCFVMDENPPTRIYVFTRRLPMMHRDGWEGNKASSQMNTAWFVWEANDDGSYGDGYPRLIRVNYSDFETAPALAPGAGGNIAPAGLSFRAEPDEFARETPRKTAEERVSEEFARAMAFAAQHKVFDLAGLRKGIAVRPLVAEALVADMVARGVIAADGDGYVMTDAGRMAVAETVDVQALEVAA
ncbi:hypothetical protein [Rhizobium sp. SGZ-381]|uniref:hypothetical protein n=1 Tax=Rhizobium sp. SGZ-381 TaxID=3342800 RepID=UPI0036705D91